MMETLVWTSRKRVHASIDIFNYRAHTNSRCILYSIDLLSSKKEVLKGLFEDENVCEFVQLD